MRYRQSLLKFADKYGVSRASRKYNKSRSYIYFWRSRWDGSLESLCCQSRRPHHHPNQHTETELALIRNMRRRNPDLGISELWGRLKKRGYSRTVEGLYRVMCREGLLPVKPAAKPYKPKPYEQMAHPGERVQIDVKVVPRSCIADPELHLFQYTAIDEYSRYRVLRAYPEQSTYSSADFLKKVVRVFAMKGVHIECVQTDNGFEFIHRFSRGNESKPTLFEATAASLGIRHKLIRPYTPDTTARLSAVTAKTRSASTRNTAFTPSQTLDNSSPTTKTTPTAAPCVLFTGHLPATFSLTSLSKMMVKPTRSTGA